MEEMAFLCTDDGMYMSSNAQWNGELNWSKVMWLTIFWSKSNLSLNRLNSSLLQREKMCGKF